MDWNGVIYYTIGDSTLYKMDKNGADLGNVAILAAAGPIDIDGIAWDNGRKVLWGNQHGSNPVAIYTINPTTGTATKAFDSQTTSVGTFRDGLAYDASDDSLWESGDISSTIEHYKASDGTLINTITPKNAVGGTLGNISGVVVGVGDLLYLGQDGLQQIVQVKKSDGAFINVFASPGGARDEGLECDAVNFTPKTALLSREFNTPGFVSAIELAAGTCGCGGGPATRGAIATPTLNEWGMLILVALLGLASTYHVARRRKARSDVRM